MDLPTEKSGRTSLYCGRWVHFKQLLVKSHDPRKKEAGFGGLPEARLATCGPAACLSPVKDVKGHKEKYCKRFRSNRTF